MKDLKIAFFDVDGTMIDMYTRKISPRMIETLNKLQNNGVKICMATGRPLLTIPSIEGVEFDVLLTFNGSYCCDNKDIIYKYPIPKRDVQKIISNAARIDRPVSLASESRIGANGTDRDLEFYFQIAGEELKVVEDFDEFSKGDIYQVMMACRPEEHEALLQDVKGAEITGWWEHAIDIIPRGGGKGVCVEKVLEHYGISRDEAVAFGDGGNDIAMLKTVGTGVAMGNASDEVKKYADEVCGKVDEDGIYHFCLQKGWIDK